MPGVMSVDNGRRRNSIQMAIGIVHLGGPRTLLHHAVCNQIAATPE